MKKTTTRNLTLLLAAVGLAVTSVTASEVAVAGPSRPSAVATTAPAHSLASARKHTAVGHSSWQHDTLASHSQQNWYRLTLTSRGYVYGLLGTLPADYNLRLYAGNGTLLTSSDHGGTQVETVGRTVNAGTYFLRVATSHGSSARTKYSLLVRVVPATETIGILTAHVGRVGDVVGDMVNVSSQSLTVAMMDVAYYDSAGHLLRKYNHLSTYNALWIPMAPGARMPFDALTSNVPQSVQKKATRIVLTPYWSTATARTPAPLTVSSVRRVTRTHAGLTETYYTGRIHNASSRTLPLAAAVVEARDSRGVLVGVAHSTQRLTSHATGSFSVGFLNWQAHLSYTVKGFETVSETS